MPATRSAPTEAFGALARRLTGWYVFVATSVVTLLLAATGIAAIGYVAHGVNLSIATLRATAEPFAIRAAERGDSFEQAAIDFESRQRRDGVRMVAGVPPRRPPEQTRPQNGASRMSAPPPEAANSLVVIDGVPKYAAGLRARFEGSRFGFAVATLFGVRVAPPQPFLEGMISFGPDPQLFQNMALAFFAIVFLAAVLVAVTAWLIGRYITGHAIRPLVDVTEALQRFAARDFRTHPITVAERSDFAVLGHAYNAAAAQVGAAFEEREAAEAQMRQFVADAGHELRTPLTIVLGYIDVLRRRMGELDARTRDVFDAIGSEGRRMRVLIDNLVLLAKLEGEETRPVEPFAFAPLIEEIVELRRGVSPGVRFDVDLRADGEVIGDRPEIYEAVANIVDNALKYAPGSPVRIDLTAGPGAALTLAVADEGPGIDPRDREAIFERFYRGASRGEVEGSGLGLAIAKRAVERAGGSLRLDERVERGTRFVMTLRADKVVERGPRPGLAGRA